MSYGVNKWQSGSGRARSAGSSSARKRKPVKRKKSPSAQRAPKRKPRAKRSKTSQAVRAPSAKRTSKKRSTSAKLYKIYDLQSGGRLLKVRKDDPRYEEEDEAMMEGRPPRYVHRKPSKKTKQEYAIGSVIGATPAASLLSTPAAQAAAVSAAAGAGKVAYRAVPKIAKALAKVAMPVGAGIWQGSTVALGSAGVLGLLAAAGLGSYFGTRYIIENFPTRARRLEAAATAYRTSRRDLAAKLGRELTAGEQKELAAHYKDVVRGINDSRF
jgi:hypothetical protein